MTTAHTYVFQSPGDLRLDSGIQVHATALDDAIREAYDRLQDVQCTAFWIRKKDHLYFDEARGIYHTGRGISRALRKDRDLGTVRSYLAPTTYPLGADAIRAALEERWVEGVPEKFEGKLTDKLTPTTALMGTGSHPYVGWFDRAHGSLQSVARSHPSLDLECVEIYSGDVVCWVVLAHYKRTPAWASKAS